MTFLNLIEQCNLDEKFRSSHETECVNKINEENETYNAVLKQHILRRESSAPVNSLALYGLTFVVKDNISIISIPTSLGLKPPFLEKAEANADVVSLFLDKGCCLVGISNMDAGAVGSYGDNTSYGRIFNPINREIIPGGSSGGSAVAVAGGWCDFAIGSDHGGSVRIPAAACAISALRLSPGSLNSRNAFLLDESLDSLGIFTRDVADLNILISRLFPQQEALLNFSETNIAIPCDEDLQLCDEPLLSAYLNFVEKIEPRCRLQKLKYKIGFEDALRIRKTFLPDCFSRLIQPYSKEFLPNELKALCSYANQITDTDKTRAKNDCLNLKQNIGRLISDGTFLLTPTIPFDLPTWKDVDSGALNSNVAINFFLTLANVLMLPALSFAGPQHSNLSLQLVGKQGADRKLAELGSLLGHQ